MYSARSDQYELAGFPHSEISGSRVVCTSPELIAAYHVLHRLHAPRHPPCALSSLTIKFAHRKLDQHIVSLTPSSSRMPESSLDDPKHPEKFISIFGNLPIRLSKSTETTLVFLMQTSLETIVYQYQHGSGVVLIASSTTLMVEVRGLEPLTPWLQTMCSAN